MMANLSFIIGIIGNVVSILVFTSPIGTFRRVVKKKSTENFKSIPYVATLLSTSLWTFYGLLKPDGLLVSTVNGAGAALQTIYVILFLIYAPKDTKIKTLKLFLAMDIGFLGAVVAITLLALHGSQQIVVVGFLCAGLTLGMYGSPMAAMRTVIKTKSVEFMPFFLSFFLFLNGGVWTVYSILVRDFFIGVPNAIGFVLGSVQLILYAVYKKGRPASTKTTEAEEEEGSAHLVEMGAYESETQKTPSLIKGRSMPKPTVSRQLSLQRILKTYSLTPYELYSSQSHKHDEET
ncbi:bidirectional sugar transporter SWEET16-like [Aristolochia californica]|uniref:bidirectional sugar transporter SWEET16-like n=1 Tax=Aristolochia californica TaxID=171875 RepID=UPI0035DF8A91